MQGFDGGSHGVQVAVRGEDALAEVVVGEAILLHIPQLLIGSTQQLQKALAFLLLPLLQKLLHPLAANFQLKLILQFHSFAFSLDL